MAFLELLRISRFFDEILRPLLSAKAEFTLGYQEEELAEWLHVEWRSMSQSKSICLADSDLEQLHQNSSISWP